MATTAQIAANRLNAQQSTGPRTPEGKAVSSQNAFKSGLDADSQFCYGEERADFYRLQVEYFTRFSPQSPEERFHVDTLLRNEWSLRRLFRAEAHLWEFNTTHCSRRDGAPLGEGFNNSSPVFMRLHRRITLFEKSYEASLTKIQTLQEARRASDSPPARATEEELTYPGPTIYTFGFDRTPLPPRHWFPPKLASFLKWGRRPCLRRTPWSGFPNLPLNPSQNNPPAPRLASFLPTPINPPMSPQPIGFVPSTRTFRREVR